MSIFKSVCVCVVRTSSVPFCFSYPYYWARNVDWILNCRMGKTFDFTTPDVLAFKQLKHFVLWSQTRANSTPDWRLLASSTLKPCLQGVSYCFFPSFLSCTFCNLCSTITKLLPSLAVSHTRTLCPLWNNAFNASDGTRPLRKWRLLLAKLTQLISDQVQSPITTELLGEFCRLLLSTDHQLICVGFTCVRYEELSIQWFGIPDSFLHCTPL